MVDAATGAPIPGATVSLGAIATTTTDASGAFAFTDVPAGVYVLETSATGYITNTTDCTIVADGTDTKVVALAAVSTSQISAVLTWGSIPTDLDLHASGPDGAGRFHAWYNDKTPVDYVELDLDDTSSFGPETMAVKISPSSGGVFVAGTYRIWVHDYTNRSGTPQWGLSNAQVVLNGLSGQLASYSVATALAGQGGVTNPDDDLWRVVQFDLDSAGAVSNIVVFQDFVAGTQSTADV